MNSSDFFGDCPSSGIIEEPTMTSLLAQLHLSAEARPSSSLRLRTNSKTSVIKALSCMDADTVQDSPLVYFSCQSKRFVDGSPPTVKWSRKCSRRVKPLAGMSQIFHQRHRIESNAHSEDRIEHSKPKSNEIPIPFHRYT